MVRGQSLSAEGCSLSLAEENAAGQRQQFVQARISMWFSPKNGTSSCLMTVTRITKTVAMQCRPMKFP